VVPLVQLQALAPLVLRFGLHCSSLEAQAAVVTAPTLLVDLVVMVPLALEVEAVVLVEPQVVAVLAVKAVQV
jgi:hypothetical protein